MTKELDFEQLADLAGVEVRAVIAALPKPLRKRAENIPVTFEKYPGKATLRDGVAPDTMGLFVGSEFVHETDGNGELPPQVILYLGNIWEEAEGNIEKFKFEVRQTLMHELGHYLGLDEDDLWKRDLE